MKSTTKYMVSQTELSIKLMKNNYQDRDKFIREFQNFISNARSILDYLKNEYSHIIGSMEYIDAYRKYLYNNPFSRFFINARNFSIHEKPMQVIVSDKDSKGRHSNYCHVDADGFEPEADLYFDSSTAKVEKYYFADYPNSEVTECCQKYLE